MRVIFLVFIFCLATAVPVRATDAVPAMHHFTVADGLPSLEVHCIFQDSHGKIWIGTDVGVSCFDGVTFVNYSKRDNLPDHTFFGITEDKAGRIWFRSYNGLLSWFDGEKIVQPAVNAILSQKLKGRVVMSEDIDDHDTIWIGLKNKTGWLKIPPGFTQVIESPGTDDYLHVREIRRNHLVANVPESHRDIFFQPSGAKACTIPFTGEDWPYTAACLPGNRYVLELGDRRYLISSGKATVEPDSCHVSFIYPEADGSYWLCGARPGGARLMRPGNPKDEMVQHYLRDYDVTGCLRDHEGGLWFSTLENGLFYMPFPEMQDVYALPIATGDHVTAMTSWPGGGVLTGTLRGKFYFADNGSCVEWKGISGQPGGSVNCMSTIGDALFIGGTEWGGIYNCTKKQFTRLHNTTMLRSVSVKCAMAYDQQRWCVASISALFWVNKETGKMDTLLGQLPERINSIARTQGDTLWLGGFSRLWMLIPGKKPVDWSERFPLIAQTDYLTGDTINGKLWILSRSSGVFVLDNGRLTEIHVQQPSLPVVCREMCLGNLSLWLGTNEGVWELQNSPEGKPMLRNFDHTNGLPVNDINHISISGNRIWSSGDHMLFSFQPQQYPENKIPPQVCFRKIFCNDLLVATISGASEFEHEQNTFHFRLAGQTYKSFGHPVFLVRLLGIDEWHRVTEPDITYYNLPPGDYKFVAYALNNSGVGSLVPVIYSFSILPPFWKRSWFTAIIVGVLILTTFILVRNYLNRFRREETYRRSMSELEITAIRAQMNPHFIFNAINSIYNFVLTADRKASASYVARFARLIRNVLEFASLKKITLEQELETLKLYMDIEQLRFREAFEYEINIDPQLHPSSVQLVPMLLQPYVENAIWHGLSPKDGKGKITISIAKNEDHLSCTIDDNGVGRGQAALAKQPGLAKEPLSSKLNHRRLELLRDLYGTKFFVQCTDKYLADGTPAGTTITLHIPQL